MSSSLRRGALAGAAIVFSIASLSACGAGNDAQTLQIRPDNAATSVDDLKLQNVNVITQPEPDVQGPAVVALTIFNEGVKPQTLESITLPGSDAKVKLTPAKGSEAVTVPAQGRVIIGGKGNASAVIENGNQEMSDGSTREIVFRFSETGNVKLLALVFPATGYYKGFGPTEAPRPTQSPSGSPSGTPTGNPSGTPASPEAPEGDTEAAGSEPELPTDSASASHSAGH